MYPVIEVEQSNLNRITKIHYHFINIKQYSMWYLVERTLIYHKANEIMFFICFASCLDRSLHFTYAQHSEERKYIEVKSK